MRLVRLDHLPGGRSLELDPRLTVLVGAPSEVTGSVAAAARALVGGDAGSVEGQVELHGIRLNMHDRVVGIDGGAGVDPVLDLDAPTPLRPVARVRSDDVTGTRGGGPVVEMSVVDEMPDPEVDPARHTRRIAADDLTRLRSDLRSLDGERMVLDRRTAEVRTDLDSFAAATLDVALGQLAAVEARQAASRAERSTWAESRDRLRREIDARIEWLQEELRAPSDVHAVGSGGSAGELADMLDALRRSSDDLSARRVAVEGLLQDTERQIASAARDAHDLGGPSAAAAHEPEIVKALEAVRDEIHQLEERPSGRRGPDDRARIGELRAVEAELLDHLGYDTYTAFLLSTTGRRSDAAVDLRRQQAEADLRRLEQEADRLRLQLSDTTGEEQVSSERSRIRHSASQLLDVPTDALERLTTTELVDLLRSRRDTGDERRSALREALDEAERERAELDEGPPVTDDGGREADLDAEAQALTVRIADCRDRVARHQRATAELAELRARELELRERERDLLVRISDRERLLGVLSSDVAPQATPRPPEPPLTADLTPPHVPTATAGDLSGAAQVESLRRRVESDAPIAWPVDREWLLLARLGAVRSVGTIGSVPLVVSGIDPSATDAAALLHRITSMSELVQIVIHTDDERLARWGEGLGEDATVIRW